MFASRISLRFIKAARMYKNTSLLTQNFQMHSFKKLPVVPTSSLLKYNLKIELQTRNYAKGKNKKKEKGTRFLFIH